MTQPYLGEIRMFAGTFSPKNNAFCAGQIVNIQQNTGLFSLIGSYFGGNGTTTFGLPDMRGRIPVGMGQGNGLSNYNIGETTGTESVNLSVAEMPMHNHMMLASSNTATQPSPVSNMPGGLVAPFKGLWIDSAKTGTAVPMDPNSLLPVGNNVAHENRMPALAINFIIALVGLFPSRN
jgi:microcystin-dependent protein